MSNLLLKLTGKNVLNYVKDLKKGKSCPKVDAILLALYAKANLLIYTLDETGLIKQSFTHEASKGRQIKIYLEPNGKFDSLYDKGTIKSAGICQSIILDVSV